ncbi:discoidin domain-containing protein [Microbulbifer sp. ALW1]|uniref:discoidin domain-containing protein n=1 Tax=Microbulbifer sp. (strain ALW1) TaxID=1516059 RepID=UPI001F28EBD5|nr:discoidin domain-containing protein [Microbulbifer sp. ALW1]
MNRKIIQHPLARGVALAASLAAGNATAQTLIWSDEFNSGSLDETVWNIETGTGINGNWGTGQLDRATERPENLNFINGVPGADGGVLSITTRNESYIDRDYTSGRINTQGKVAFGPGHKIEARVWPRDVRYQGQGFAFWMMPNEIPSGFDYLMWPQGGEVDIMEYVGSIPYHNLATVHYAWFWENNEYQDWNHGHLGGYYSFKDQQGPDEPEWIAVDLGQSMSFDQVVLHWEGAYGKSYKIHVSDDNINWSDVYATSNGDGGTDTLNLTGSGRYVRMYGTERATEWSYSLFEFEIFAGGVNQAYGKPVTTSSSQASDLTGANAVDGEYSTRWSSNLRNPGYGGYPPLAGDPSAGSSGFHTYGINWYQNRIEFYVDDNVYHIHYLNDGDAYAPDGNDEAHTQKIDGRRVYVSEYSNHFDEWHPFERQMYLILSAGVGGPSGYTYGGGIVPEAQFPVSVLVDWVRIYQIDDDGESTLPDPQPDPDPEPEGDLAQGKSATASSSESEAMNATAAVDGNSETRWASAWNDGEWLAVDLGANYTIDQVLLEWEAAFASGYQVQVSGDGQSWQTVRTVVDGDGGQDVIANLNASGRHLRILVDQRGTGYGASLWELEVFGDSGVPVDSDVDKAAGKPVAASSVEGNYWFAEYAVDGNPSTRWASDASDPQWISVDLGAVEPLSKVVLDWEAAFGKSYQVQLSNDGVNWVTAANVSNGDGGVDEIAISGSGRYVRIFGTERGTGYGYSLWRFEVY